MRRTVAFPVSLNSLLHWHGIRVQSLAGVCRAYGGCRVLGGCEHSRLKISFPCQRISCCRLNAVIHGEETQGRRGGERQGSRGERKGERRGKEIKEKERRREKRTSEERKGKTVKER